MAADTTSRGFLPAAGRAPLMFFDLGMALLMREQTFRSRLIEQVLDGDTAPDVLDIGCGTGTLAIMLARRGARVVAIDPDPAVLKRARRKPGATMVQWEQGDATSLRIRDQSVDRAVFSVVLHHLDDAQKLLALRDARRVLRPDGSLHVADFTVPGDPVMRLASRAVRLIDGVAGPASLARGELGDMLVPVRVHRGHRARPAAHQLRAPCVDQRPVATAPPMRSYPQASRLL